MRRTFIRRFGYEMEMRASTMLGSISRDFAHCWQRRNAGSRDFLFIIVSMKDTPPKHTLQRFEVAGESRRRIRRNEGLLGNQTESAGADESTVPWPSRGDSNRGVPRPGR